MDTFCLIHISDLHIHENESKGYSNVRDSLIEDLLKIKHTHNLTYDAIAMTGDIVDRGGSFKSFEIGEQFFQNLLTSVGVSNSSLTIVPGNHDFPRKSIYTHFINNAIRGEIVDQREIIENWETLASRFNTFNNFLDRVTTPSSYKKGGYGGIVQNIQIGDGGFIVQFVLLNSSWSCIGPDDYGKLCIGNWQLEELKNLQDGMPEATLKIALIHHPLDWLLPTEQQGVYDYLKDPKLLGVDVVLHGHVHSSSIKTFSDPDTTLTTLISGIGYPDQSSREIGFQKQTNCRYAIYQFNLTRNEIEIWLRVSRDDGFFVADTSLYKKGGEDGHFSIPFKKGKSDSHKVQRIDESETEIVELDPIPLISHWVGRSEEIGFLIDPKLRAGSITGVGGQGKTALATEVLRRYSRGPQAIYQRGVWIDCRELPDLLHSKIIDLLEVLSNGEESTLKYMNESVNATARRLLKHLQQKKTILVFDNIDAYINADTEGPSRDLQPFVDAILNNEHESFVLFTCRPPFNDARGSFRQIQLAGLSYNETIDFFEKRGIELAGDNDRKYIQTLVNLTNGHPWWLGLIVGQINSNKDTLKRCVESGKITSGTLIKEYFRDIWNPLSVENKRLLRFLVEASRPLAEFEIMRVLDKHPDAIKAKDNIRRLERLGMLERHEGIHNDHIVYQVHPLIREFIHNNYNMQSQKNFVERVLSVFLPSQIMKVLFVNVHKLQDLNSIHMSEKNLIDSIETCINSRHHDLAWALMEQYWKRLNDTGFHHQFLSLGKRVIDLTDWNKIVRQEKSTMMLSHIIKEFGLLKEINTRDRYLRLYESAVEPNTLAHTGYLSLVAQIAWQQEKSYEKALEYLEKYEELTMKFKGQGWSIQNMKTIRGVILRDSGEVEQAVTLLKEQLNDDDSQGATDLGNYAKALLQLKNFPEAEHMLRKSLLILTKEHNYLSKTNLGYAYLWLAEVMLEQDKLTEAQCFQILCKKLWSEYAPLLLSEAQNFEIQLNSKIANNGTFQSVSLDEAKKVELRFLQNHS